MQQQSAPSNLTKGERAVISVLITLQLAIQNQNAKKVYIIRLTKTLYNEKDKLLLNIFSGFQ